MPVNETTSVYGLITITHLVQQTAKRPDVRFEVVPIFMYSLWRHVIRRTHCKKKKKKSNQRSIKMKMQLW